MGTVIQNRLIWNFPYPSFKVLVTQEQEVKDFEQLWLSEVQKADSFYKDQLAHIFLILYNSNDLLGLSLQEIISKFLRTNSQSNIEDLILLVQNLKSYSEKTVTNLIETSKLWDELHSSNISSNLLICLFTQKFYHDSSLDSILLLLNQQHQDQQKVNSNNVLINQIQKDISVSSLNEITELCQMVSKMPENLLPLIVAHRGFHSAEEQLERPLENTLQAFETAWSNGVRNCECDVFLTADEQILIFHDNDLHRLSLFPKSESSTKHITELGINQIISSPLKNGVRCPLLKEVLESTIQINNNSQLVIEIKHDPANISFHLAKFLLNNPQYLPHVPVVMSFDLEKLNEFQQYFYEIQQQQQITHGNLNLIQKPKVMLLTCLIGTSELPHEKELSVKDSEAIINLIKNKNNKYSLDGVYMQFEDIMLTTHQEVLSNLCEQYSIGVWDCKPDNINVAIALQKIGLQFINTDFPHSFIV